MGTRSTHRVTVTSNKQRRGYLQFFSIITLTFQFLRFLQFFQVLQFFQFFQFLRFFFNSLDFYDFFNWKIWKTWNNWKYCKNWKYWKNWKYLLRCLCMTVTGQSLALFFRIFSWPPSGQFSNWSIFWNGFLQLPDFLQKIYLLRFPSNLGLPPLMTIDQQCQTESNNLRYQITFKDIYWYIHLWEYPGED